jgi:hypothetical protein
MALIERFPGAESLHSLFDMSAPPAMSHTIVDELRFILP